MELLWIILIILAAVFASQMLLFIVWLRGNLNLSNFFKSKKTVWLFFVPVVGVFAFITGAAKARINEDFTV